MTKMNLLCGQMEGLKKSGSPGYEFQGVSMNRAEVKNNGHHCHFPSQLLRVSLSLVLALCVVFLGGTAGECQTFYGSIVGSVADSSGRV